MATSMSPSREGDKINAEDEAEENVFFFRHVRTASVILPSGDRVRRKVSLMSTYDENPFEDDEQTALIDSGGTEGTIYSSIEPSLADRSIQPWEVYRYDKFKNWLHSEGLKRY